MTEAQRSELEGIVAAVIFPALSMLDSNTAISQEVWNIIGDLHYSARYVRGWLFVCCFYVSACPSMM